MDGGKRAASGDVYDSFFRAVGAPSWHGQNFNAIRDSISVGGINEIEVPSLIRIRDYSSIGPEAKGMAKDFVEFIKELHESGCPVDVEIEDGSVTLARIAGSSDSQFMTLPNNIPHEQKETERIAKVIARAGLCSRRDAERWIADGRVSVNGKKLETPAFTVGPSDTILVDGKPLPSVEATRLFLYHKPLGLVTTARDEKGRATVFANLPPGLPRVISVGRLDLNSEGLLLLTNDGGLARYLELPANAWKRRYRVRVHGRVKAGDLAKVARGVTVEGMNYGPIEATIERAQTGANVWLSVTLQEGKNREIRKVMAHLGLEVSRLLRTGYGPFQLGDLPAGSVEEVPSKILRERISEYFAQRPGTGAAPAPERH
jgi:23S rRNA pseudouridine2605 synthase